MKIFNQKRLVIRLIFSVFIIVLSTLNSHGQDNNDRIQWSATRKLTVDDFFIKTSNKATSSFAQFSIEYQVTGFDFLRKNFNKKVNNFMIPTASWIDTTKDVNQSLRYQQVLFDLSEVYARKFRQTLKENRSKISTNGTSIAKELNDKIMTEFAKRRLKYEKDIQSGNEISEISDEWDINIQSELKELAEFAYEK